LVWAACTATGFGRAELPTDVQETGIVPIASADTAILTAALFIILSTPLAVSSLARLDRHVLGQGFQFGQ
jgi:hypothetical protein